jgi:simple sugar transport system permease protein
VTDQIVAALLATVAAGTPLVFAALGELVTEKSGVLNLGVEGMMLVGAISAFAATVASGSSVVGVVAGMAAGAVLALVFAVLTLTLMANQVAAGLALSLFGVGFSAFVGKGYESVSLPAQAPVGEQWLVYASWLLFAGVAWFLYRSRPGLVLRSVGESPKSAHAIGYPVIAIRYVATLFGGAMAGVAGAFLSVFHTPLWVENMTAGRGWIALALVVFATWRPARVIAGSYLFGGVTVAQFYAQGEGAPIASQFLSMLPYLATIVVLVLISRNPNTIRLNAPVALGKPFHPDGG